MSELTDGEILGLPTAEDYGRWLNVATKVESVERGDEISAEVSGGFARKTAPHAGFVVESKNGNTIYVPGNLLEVEIEEEAATTCIVKNCRSAPVGDLGGLCRGCWCFASGEPGGDGSTARRNALAAAKANR